MRDITHNASAGLDLPPLPILSPTALCGDAGDGKASLRWNPQLEDARVLGWKVLQLSPEQKERTEGSLTTPNQVVDGLVNDTPYTFCVVGVLSNGSLTPPSNTVTVIPHATSQATVEPLQRGSSLAFGRFQTFEVGENAVKVVFPDGQELLFDNFRPIDWRTRDGEHLLYPRRFGNGVDIGKFDHRGLPVVIPPGGLEGHRDAQQGTVHPYITDPYTLPMDREWHDAHSR